MDLIKSKTFQNLVNSFAGECQAHMRYKYLAYGAKDRSLFMVERQIQELSKNEMHHARMFYTFIQSADTQTLDNLQVSSGYPFKEKTNRLLGSSHISYYEIGVERIKSAIDTFYGCIEGLEIDCNIGLVFQFNVSFRKLSDSIRAVNPYFEPNLKALCSIIRINVRITNLPQL